MPKNDSSKKHAKKLARKKELAKKQQRLARLRERAQRFKFTCYVEEETPREFAVAVHEAAAQIDFEDRSAFSELVARGFALLKQVGDERVRQRLWLMAKETGVDLTLGDLLVLLGEAVFRRMDRDLLLAYIPFHNAVFFANGNDVVIGFRSLRRAKGPGGTVYYSRHEPKVEEGGRALTVAFSGHAIRRICERVCFQWPSYANLRYAFSLFDECLEFDPCTLHPDILGFTFFENLRTDTWSLRMAKAILGEAYEEGRDYAFRVGYCPGVVEGPFFKAKTFLFPGFDKTPEYGKIMTAAVPADRRRAMVLEAKELDANRLLEPGRLDLLKWFHDQGVAQIIPRKVRYATVTD